MFSSRVHAVLINLGGDSAQNQNEKMLAMDEFGRRFVPKRPAFKGSSTLVDFVLLQLAVRRIWSRDGTTWRPSIANYFGGLGISWRLFSLLVCY